MRNLYHTTKWKAKREMILRRDGYLCQLSKRYGKYEQAETVHHIFPLEEFPEYALESWNLISVTKAMHNSLHDRATNALTHDGVELLRRTARKNGIPIPLRYEKG